MPKLSLTQQNSRRQHILAAAETCFVRTGFHATTIQAICREARVSAGALYLYFNSKEALIEGIAEGERERVLADFAQMRDAPDFLSGLDHCINNCVMQQSRAKTALFLEVVAEAARNPAVMRTLQRVDAAIRQAMRDLFVRAQSAGRIAGHVGVDDLVDVMATTIDGLLLRHSIDPAFDPRRASAVMMQTIKKLALGDVAPFPETLVRLEPSI